MATFNSIDGQITSGGDNPPLNVEFAATNYMASCSAVGGSVTFIDPSTNRERIRTGTLCTFSIRASKIISTNNVSLRDVGLIFQIPKPTTMPTFIDLTSLIGKTFPVKTLKVYFGTPVKPFGTIVYTDEKGTPQNQGLFGTTVEIKATRIITADNVRIEEIGVTIQPDPIPVSQPQPVAPQPAPSPQTQPISTSQPTINPLSDHLKSFVTKIFNDARNSNITVEQYINQYLK
jgi:hypothetical protein